MSTHGYIRLIITNKQQKNWKTEKYETAEKLLEL